MQSARGTLLRRPNPLWLPSSCRVASGTHDWTEQFHHVKLVISTCREAAPFNMSALSSVLIQYCPYHSTGLRVYGISLSCARHVGHYQSLRHGTITLQCLSISAALANVSALIEIDACARVSKLAPSGRLPSSVYAHDLVKNACRVRRYLRACRSAADNRQRRFVHAV